MRTDVRIDGDKELIRKFKRLNAGFGKQALESVVMDGAEIIEAEARARAPVRAGGGRLRDAIMSEPLKQVGYRHSAAVGTSWRVKRGISGAGKASQHPAFYGIMVEEGTRPRFRKKGKGKGGGSTGTMPAQPFLGPAFDAKKNLAAKKVKEGLSGLIRRFERKGSVRG
jgi:HK97 gp10 family phage protein